MTKSEYQRYLASREWALKREAIRQRANNHCERCKYGPFDQVHHLTYEHKGDEPLEDLQGLCEPCHLFLSAKSDKDPCDNPLPECPRQEWDGPPPEELIRRAMLQPRAEQLADRVHFQCPGCREEAIGHHLLPSDAVVFNNGKWWCNLKGRAHTRAIGIALGVVSDDLEELAEKVVSNAVARKIREILE